MTPVDAPGVGLIVIYSKTSKYAVMMLTQMGMTAVGDPVRVSDLSKRTGIPYPYLTKIARTLVTRGILSSTRGRGGGVRFARQQGAITLLDVVSAIEGPHAYGDCLFGLGACDRGSPCSLHSVWGPVREQVIGFLQGTTIGDLVTRAQ